MSPRTLDELDGLRGIIDVGVGRDLDAVLVEGLEGHDLLVLKPRRVEGELKLDGAVGLVGREAGGRFHLLVAHHEGFAGGLVHEHALDGVLLARQQVLVNIIRNHHHPHTKKTGHPAGDDRSIDRAAYRDQSGPGDSRPRSSASSLAMSAAAMRASSASPSRSTPP